MAVSGGLPLCVLKDEMGSNTSLWALYGWSRVGERLRAEAPKNWAKNVTLLCSMSIEGLGPSVAVAGATTRVTRGSHEGHTRIT